jgi:hypothetical protein
MDLRLSVVYQVEFESATDERRWTQIAVFLCLFVFICGKNISEFFK